MLRARETATRQRRRLVSLTLAVLMVITLSAGFYIYKNSIDNQAESLQYEGFRIYFGLYEKRPMIKTERFKKALERFKKAYELRESPFSLFYIANCHYALGNYKEALAVLQQLNLRFPDDERYVPLSYYKMAMASIKAGNTEEALKSLDVLYNYRTDSYKDLALFESARLLDSMGRTEEAEKKYKAITKDFPYSPFFKEASLKVKDKKG